MIKKFFALTLFVTAISSSVNASVAAETTKAATEAATNVVTACPSMREKIGNWLSSKKESAVSAIVTPAKNFYNANSTNIKRGTTAAIILALLYWKKAEVKSFATKAYDAASTKFKSWRNKKSDDKPSTTPSTDPIDPKKKLSLN